MLAVAVVLWGLHPAFHSCATSHLRNEEKRLHKLPTHSNSVNCQCNCGRPLNLYRQNWGEPSFRPLIQRLDIYETLVSFLVLHYIRSCLRDVFQ